MEYLKIAYGLVRPRKGARLPLAPLPDTLGLILLGLVKALPDTLGLILRVVRPAALHTHFQSQKGLKVSGKVNKKVLF
jgi:hypothetical protein